MIQARPVLPILRQAFVLIMGGSLSLLWSGCAPQAGPNHPVAPAGVSSQSSPSPIRLQWVENPAAPGRPWIEVIGISKANLRSLPETDADAELWNTWWTFKVVPTNAVSVTDSPAMLGRYERDSDRIRFQPRFPLQPGLVYEAVFHADRLPELPTSKPGLVFARFFIPAPDLTPKTSLVQVYPSAEVLPENLLKFYLEFSGPMRRGRIYDHIHLLNDQNQTVQLPFLEIDEELWNPAMTRLTLFIDPGRIKRGVKPLEEIGPSIEAGHRYTLVVDRAWQDADGAPLRKSFRKSFRVEPPDRTPIDPRNWTVHPPQARTRRPLVVNFAEPLDYGLAQRVIQVAGPNLQNVPGQVRLTDHERHWEFVPEQPWLPGDYQLTTLSILEDLAGNSVGKPFEVDVFDKVESRPTARSVAIPFQVAP